MQTRKKQGIRRAIVLGRKEGAADALSFLLEQGVDVTLVVAKADEPLAKRARAKRIPVFASGAEVYALIEKKSPLVRDIDLVISYLFAERIREPLIRLPKKGCVNFHPAPLPDYKGRAGYNTAILDGRKTYGVSAHFIDSEKLDAGPIIDVVRFPFDHKTATVRSLERESQAQLLRQFKKVLRRFISGKPVRTSPNVGGTYLTGTELEALKQVHLTDSAEEIEKKIRAFFFPPHHGAKISIGGTDFTLVDKRTLEGLAELLAQHRY